MSGEANGGNGSAGGSNAGNSNGPLLTAHAALVLLIAVLAGTAAGILTYLAGNPPAAAVLAGGSAFGAAAALAHSAIG